MSVSALCTLQHRRDPDRPRRAVPGTLTCAACRADLARILVGEDRYTGRDRVRLPGLAELVDELTEGLASSACGGARVGGSRATGLRYRVDAADHVSTVRSTLAVWTQRHATARGEHGVALAGVRRVAGWLSDRLDWATQQPWITDYATELRHMHGRAQALIDPDDRRRFYLPDAVCRRPLFADVDQGDAERSCWGRLVADVSTKDGLLPSEVWCEGCGHTWPPSAWYRLGVTIHERQQTQVNVDVAS